MPHHYPIFETHAHLYFPNFKGITNEIIKGAQKVRVSKMVQISCEEISSLAALKIAKEQEGQYSTIGLHPCDVLNIGEKDPKWQNYEGLEDYKPQCRDLEDLVAFWKELYVRNKEHIVAVGETGFDRYHDDSESLLAAQKKSLKAHLELAQEFQLPLVIHNRNSRDECLEFLEAEFDRSKHPAIPGIMHCFCEDIGYAQKVTQDYGFMLGIGGVATYPASTAIREVIKNIPLTFLVTETDSPFLTPHQAKQHSDKKRVLNEPKYLPEVVELIADLKKISINKCADILFENALRTFQLNR